MVRRLRYSLNEVVAYFGKDVATVVTLLGRMGESMQSDEKQTRELDRLARTVEWYKSGLEVSLSRCLPR